MPVLDQIKLQLKKGRVYRRSDLEKWSNAVDRHLSMLLKEGTLQKLSQGVYHFPKETAFGKTPPDELELINQFLKDDNFLLISPNDYNTLGVGTTQLYNKRTVYNHKRHGKFKLGNRTFYFQMKPYFPKELTPAFLLVDLVNNLKTLADDQDVVLENVKVKVPAMDAKMLNLAVKRYGTVKSKKFFEKLKNEPNLTADSVK